MFFSQLLAMYVKSLTRTDTAFDITQVAFIKGAQEMYNLKVLLAFRFWLFRKAEHMCMKNYRKTAKKDRNRYEEDIMSQDYSVTEAIAKDNLLNRLEVVLTPLSRKDQELLHAKYLARKSIKEIMVSTSLGGSAIKMKLMRAKNKVASRLVNQAICDSKEYHSE